mmetsp:Transcript_121310/g.387657  ORF Transcript_121310/g.387657 Transcript_121310/m.387657 type:complete len:422 (+) Transcript_121310:3656-4921(+)
MEDQPPLRGCLLCHVPGLLLFLLAPPRVVFQALDDPPPLLVDGSAVCRCLCQQALSLAVQHERLMLALQDFLALHFLEPPAVLLCALARLLDLTPDPLVHLVLEATLPSLCLARSTFRVCSSWGGDVALGWSRVVGRTMVNCGEPPLADHVAQPKPALNADPPRPRIFVAPIAECRRGRLGGLGLVPRGVAVALQISTSTSLKLPILQHPHIGHGCVDHLAGALGKLQHRGRDQDLVLGQGRQDQQQDRSAIATNRLLHQPRQGTSLVQRWHTRLRRCQRVHHLRQIRQARRRGSQGVPEVPALVPLRRVPACRQLRRQRRPPPRRRRHSDNGGTGGCGGWRSATEVDEGEAPTCHCRWALDLHVQGEGAMAVLQPLRMQSPPLSEPLQGGGEDGASVLGALHLHVRLAHERVSFSWRRHP